jgi:thiol-disulfide isomerase/thioredoxin
MSSVSKKVLLVVLVLLAVAAAYFVMSIPGKSDIASDNSTQDHSVYLQNLRDLNGSVVSMHEDKLAFVNIWATWCGPCNMEMPGIQRLYDKYKNHEKVAFYIVSDEDAEIVNPFISRKGYSLPFYQFTGAYPPALDGNAIPRTYIIYKGEILAQETGASQWDRAEVIELIEKKLGEI